MSPLRTAGRLARILRACGKAAASGQCTSLMCAIPMATSSAPCIAPNDPGDRQREQVARRAPARCEAFVARDLDRHDLLDLPPTAGRGGRAAPGRLVSVGPPL